MKIAAVTSMNKRYYDLCGQLMVDSYVQNMPEQIPLTVYNEDFELSQPNVINMGWNLGKDYDDFVSRWVKKENQKILTFAKKAYSIINAMQHIDCDRLIWIDADCIINRGFDQDLVNYISPDSTLASYFGVWHQHDEKEYFSCETGFFILNKRHPSFDNFLKVYSNIYNTDDYANLRRFYDGEVFGETVARLSAQGVKFQNLSPVDKKKKYKTPIKKSVIKDYIFHYKAGSKYKLNT